MRPTIETFARKCCVAVCARGSGRTLSCAGNMFVYICLYHQTHSSCDTISPVAVPPTMVTNQSLAWIHWAGLPNRKWSSRTAQGQSSACTAGDDISVAGRAALCQRAMQEAGGSDHGLQQENAERTSGGTVSWDWTLRSEPGHASKQAEQKKGIG